MKDSKTLYRREVKSISEIAEGVFKLSFNRSFSFFAGQVIAIDLVPNGAPRLYSIASGEKDPLIEIIFDVRPHGYLTPQLANLKPGDILFASEAFGEFRTTPGRGVWIAAGTGIAPFVSMARTQLTSSKILVHGGRRDENFYYSELFEASFGNNYVRCCSQQQDTRYIKGRLTEWLRTQNNPDPHARYFLCGPAEMVVEVRDILISKNIPFNNIISETYF